MPTPESLSDALALGLYREHWSSDLIIADTPAARALVQKHSPPKIGYSAGCLEHYTHPETLERVIEIAFAYDPFWKNPLGHPTA